MQALISGLSTLCPAIVDAMPAPDAPLLQLTLLHAARDGICWEYFRHGKCPRSCCRWLHAAPEFMVVMLHLLHPGGNMPCTDPWVGEQQQQQQLQLQQQTPWVSGVPYAAVDMSPVANDAPPSPWAVGAVGHCGPGSNRPSHIQGMSSVGNVHCPHATREDAQAWPHAPCISKQGPKPVTPRGTPKPMQECQGPHIPSTEVLVQMESAATRTPSPECRHPTSVVMANDMKHMPMLQCLLQPPLGRGVLWADLAD